MTGIGSFAVSSAHQHWPGEFAAEFGAASGTGEAARGRLRERDFFRICHDLRKSFAVIFMSGSSPAAVY
ncbi:hypothetical protein ACVWYH_004776 [Bradyrhizobium sp. GM24.11]